MSKFNPEKLFIEFTQGVTETEPIIPRRYTLTHTDSTAELFLTIGSDYAFNKINYSMRDEVLGEWIQKESSYNYNVYLLVDGKFNETTAAIRDTIFRRELPLALQAIRYGDQKFFNANKELDTVPIIVFFSSSIAKYNKVENWGTFSDYIV
ncbi:hypothetical protein J2Z44_003172 [Clostridium punense]|uniref:Staygreen protein domain-containing protein n=1 Tax=Clostridium punense TaxID=1054297 RepID=A0ABS4K6E0_9CLOT|nr:MULTISPECIES: staygreen family protein [Clostridium]EQB90406.1 hypothetical protein M918_00140 [Clostridium sp. BL8]MBP2023335.1 hypothetical protein [Clostridium punense]